MSVEKELLEANKRIEFLEAKLETQSSFLISNTKLISTLRKENTQLRAKVDELNGKSNQETKNKEA